MLDSIKVEDAARLMVGPRALTLEQKKRKYPLEFHMKAVYEEYLLNPTTKHERDMYETLKRLAEAVTMFKYGHGSRIDMAVLPHEVASSVFVTIIMRRKKVYSWTNLLKKVVRDYVSNHFRKEYYEKAPTVDIHEATSDLDIDEGGQEAHFFDRMESQSGFNPEDLIYLDQMLNKAAYGMSSYIHGTKTFKSYLIATWALEHAMEGDKPSFAKYLPAAEESLYQFHYQKFLGTLRALTKAGYQYA